MLKTFFAGPIVIGAAAGNYTDGETRFAVVIDAGSSGSRAYLYKWVHRGNSQDSLLKVDPILDANKEPMVKSVSPGLAR